MKTLTFFSTIEVVKRCDFFSLVVKNKNFFNTLVPMSNPRVVFAKNTHFSCKMTILPQTSFVGKTVSLVVRQNSIK